MARCNGTYQFCFQGSPLARQPDALSKIKAGADIVEIYMGMIYKGLGLVKEVASALAQR